MSELPKGWIEAKLSDVTLPYENTDPKRESDKEFTYIDIGSIDNSIQRITDPKRFLGRDAPSRARRIIKEGDVLFSTVRTYLKNIAQVPPNLDGDLTSTGIAVLRPSSGLDERFLFHWVRSDGFIETMSQAQDGTLYPAVADKDVAAASIPLPPLLEQRRISSKVDGLTARTARARKELDRIPILVARYKQRVLELASLGDLTKDWRESHERVGWTEVSVEEIAETTFDGPFGSNLKSADYIARGVRVVRLENIGRLTFIREKETYISKKKYEGLKRHTLEANDVLFSSFIAEEIRVCRFPDDLPTSAINKADCFCIRPSADQCLPAFLTFRLAAPQTYEVLKESVHGATRPRISLKQLKAFKFELPSIEEQSEIVRRIESAFGWLDRLAADHSASERLLPKLDAAILEKAFQGELVPQDPNDEPASELLERVKAERAAAPKKKRTRNSGILTAPQEKISMAKNLQEALTEAGDWTSAQDAFQRCGIGQGATTEEIEVLYAELRQLDKDGMLETEAVSDKQGRKLHDRLRLKAA